jgi:hypothetical protein
MKKSIVFILNLLFVLLLYGQNPCTAPLGNPVFQQKLNFISSQKTESAILLRAKQLVKSSCLSSEQIKTLAGLFQNDYNRLDFAMAAYANTFDQNNFYEVYDAFAYFSSVFRLHDYVLNFQKKPIPPPPPPQPEKPSYPNYNYPDCLAYSGIVHCKPPQNERDFDAFSIQITEDNSDSRKLNNIHYHTENHCLSVEQIMKLASLIKIESQRLDYVKKAYNHCYDIGNYPAAIQVFNSPVYKQQFNDFINELNKNNNSPPPCEVNDQDFDQVMNSIKKQSFNNTRVTITKQILQSKKCFTALQIKQMVKAFDFESSRLEIAKYAYDYCIDKENYFMVNDALEFSSSKGELANYIQSRQ